MSERKMWDEKEDNEIRKIVKENDSRTEDKKLKWSDIAELLQKRIDGCRRTGKQCRERWFNHLDPTIKKDKELTETEIRNLFDLQNKLGNKWANIAKEFPGRTDNNLKNFFYSSLRRAIRQINFYVAHYKKKSNIKPFKQTILTKILNISDEKYKEKLDIKSEKAEQLARNVKEMLQILSLEDEESEISPKDAEFREKLVKGIQDFNKNCKKRKSKKVEEEEEPDLDDVSESVRRKYQAESSDSENEVPTRKGKGKINPKKQENKTKIGNKIVRGKSIKKEIEYPNNEIGPSLFQKPIEDDPFGTQNVRKRKSELEGLIEEHDHYQSLQTKKISSRYDSKSSSNPFKNEQEDILKKSASICDNNYDHLKMLTRRSSLEYKDGDFLANLPKCWTKKESRAGESIFQPNPLIGFDNMLESLNIGESIGKMNDTSVTDSTFLKALKTESKCSQFNGN